MLTPAQIKRYITDDWASKKKKFAREGQHYYDGLHDILKYDLYYYDGAGNLQKDMTRSNIQIPHPFFTELVDQQVQYMLSGDGFAKSDNPDLQKILDDYFNDDEDFTAEIYDVLTDCITKGFAYAYAYRGEDDRMHFQCADSLGVVEVRARETDDNTDYVIYWYVDRINEDGDVIKRVQVWDDQQCYYYVMINDGELLADEDEPINPRPHVIFSDEKGQMFYDSFGFVPFFRIDNSRKQTSGLRPIKKLIDDYDLMSCGLSNNLQDAAEYLVVVKGFQGDNIEELIQNVKTKKHIGVDGDDGGDVEYRTVDVPYQARQTKLELDEKNIYRFGMGFNSAQLGDGNVTNVVIKSRYALLDLKCNKLEIRLKQFLRKILKVVLAEINDQNGTDYKPRDVRFEFEREVMTNALDNATIKQTEANTEQIRVNTLLNLAQTLDDQTIIERICDVLDIDYTEIEGRLPDKAEQDPYAAIDQATETQAVNNGETDEGASGIAQIAG